MSHLEERLQADLQAIRDWVWRLGGLVEEALLNAKRTMLLRDEDLAYGTVLGDQPINRDSRECDRLCHAFIARHLPSAGHLREMASTIRVNVALERVGDYAVTICREAMQLEGPLPEHFQLQLDLLADECIDIFNQSRVSFREHNADLAIALMSAAKRVESKMDVFYEELFESGDALPARTVLAIFVVFSLLKRVADQAKNICDQTVYAVRGVAKIPKVYRILFLDRDDASRGLLAAAIGRKQFSESGQFDVATPEGGAEPTAELRSFLDSTGLETEGLVTDSLKALVHDLGDYTVMVSVNGSIYDYIDHVPFHTTAQRWDVADAAAGVGEDYELLYRSLRNQVGELMYLLAGDEAGQGAA